MGHLLPILKEIFSKPEIIRRPEEMVMGEETQTQDFFNYGQGDTVLRAAYLFHAKWASASFANCKRVLDLGTGPANQISLIAQMNPHIEFVGVDLSEKMLELARRNCANMNLKNITFYQDDITKLQVFKEQEFDGVFSSVALHHLPTEEDLVKTFQNARRVLKDNYAVYITDFLLVKTMQSIEYLLSLNKDQPDLFKQDYEASLKAAFSSEQFLRSYLPYLDLARMYTSFGAKFLMILKTKSYDMNPLALQTLQNEVKKLSKQHRDIYKNLSILFSLTGLR